jgi:hypothetical protein
VESAVQRDWRREQVEVAGAAQFVDATTSRDAVFYSCCIGLAGGSLSAANFMENISGPDWK